MYALVGLHLFFSFFALGTIQITEHNPISVLMKRLYTRPWLRPVALYNLCDSFSINDEEDDDDSEKSRRMDWIDSDALGESLVQTRKFWNE